ncbi:hypothetical protein SAMD00019534_078950, partial [Acytostelium subglobosum LB1]|uniref:hypothetical protein n=1 Tax=Acytostelium subglobosum LB1 TaxID=1410327 RepID=UPI000644D9F1
MDNQNNNNNYSSSYDKNQQQQQRCKLHNKRQMFVCYDCHQIVCDVCLAAQHSRHDFDHYNNINSQYNKNKRIKRFDDRLDTLWETLQGLAWSYDTIQISHRRVANQFRELHEYLMLVEQRHNKTLNDEFEKTTTSINNIINEIVIINNNVNVNGIGGGCTDQDDEMKNEVDVMDKLVQSILSSKTMNQFLEKEFTSSDEAMPSEGQLLDFVRRGSLSIRDTYSVTEALHMDIDKSGLETSLKGILNSSFTMLKAPTRIEHGFRNHIFSFWNDSCSMYALDTGEWTVIDDKFTPRTRIFRSVVYARGNVYVFGGRGSPNTYSRFSLIDQKWHNDLEIIGVDGGTNISTCYDGDKLIYLVGGFQNDKLLDRIDCFNIDTQQFSVGLTTPSIDSNIFIQYNKIFIVGGFVDTESKVALTDVVVFDIASQMCELPIKTVYRPDASMISGFNGKDIIFIVGNDVATEVYLSKKKSDNRPIVHTGYHSNIPCVYTQSHGLLLINGEGDNFRLSRMTDKWTPLHGTDPVESRLKFGTCHISH